MTNYTNWNFSACSSGRTDKRTFQQSFFESHFCSTFSLAFNNTRGTLVETWAFTPSILSYFLPAKRGTKGPFTLYIDHIDFDNLHRGMKWTASLTPDCGGGLWHRKAFFPNSFEPLSQNAGHQGAFFFGRKLSHFTHHFLSPVEATKVIANWWLTWE